MNPKCDSTVEYSTNPIASFIEGQGYSTDDEEKGKEFDPVRPIFKSYFKCIKSNKVSPRVYWYVAD